MNASKPRAFWAQSAWKIVAVSGLAVSGVSLFVHASKYHQEQETRLKQSYVLTDLPITGVSAVPTGVKFSLDKVTGELELPFIKPLIKGQLFHFIVDNTPGSTPFYAVCEAVPSEKVEYRAKGGPAAVISQSCYKVNLVSAVDFNQEKQLPVSLSASTDLAGKVWRYYDSRKYLLNR